MYVQRTVGRDCVSEMQPVLRFPNLPPGDCLPGVQPVYLVSEPTSRGLFVRAAACLYSLPTYIQVTPGDCQPRMSVQGAGCLYSFKIYLTGTVGWGCSQFIWFLHLFMNVFHSKSCLDFFPFIILQDHVLVQLCQI